MLNIAERSSRRAAVAIITVLLTTTSAVAADLGGNCCADLEARIAELEATAAHKGNRKVSLTVSGWVNEAIFFWDDGVERNAYVGTNELEQSRFRVNGEAKIFDGWTAGYILEVGANGAGSKSFDQDNAGGTAVTVRKSAWFVKSKEFGKVTVGRFDTATYHLIDNVDTTLTRNVSDFEAAGIAIAAFKTRVGGVLSKTKWTDLMGGFNNGTPGQSGLRQTARYDTPEFAGFVASASWGEDDQWETALKYKGELGDFKLNAAVGYGESTDSGTNRGECAAKGATGDCQWWGIGALASHVPTGFYVYGGYAENHIDLTPAFAPSDDTSTTWYLQGGIEQKWNSLGKTNIFAEFRHDNVGLTSAADTSSLDLWAAGIAQNVEAADITFYALYRRYDGDFTKGAARTELDSFDMVITGAKINF
ncbi:MAG: porin [Hyphomicrobium sp.]